MQYSGFIFLILQRSADNTWFLLQSETRPHEIAHCVEKLGRDWKCTCEDATMNLAEPCKHRIFIRAVVAEIKNRAKLATQVKIK